MKNSRRGAARSALHTSALYMTGASVVALATLVAMSGSAMAQDTAQPAAKADDTKEVVVIGSRKALQNAQQRKKTADTVVDSISATDLGAFPDKSVAEAVQRVAGVTVSRYASRNDTAHLTGDPDQVIVRGLTQVSTLFNGRESFSVNGYRGLNFADVTTELLNSVDVYKNQTSDLVEGGIAGTVDLHTRLPFDTRGQQIAASIDYSEGDLAKRWDPAVSALYSNRWSTAIGEFGFLIDAAYSKTATNSQNEQFGQTVKLDKSYFGTSGTAYLPGGIYWRDAHYDRTRKGLSAAGQWQNNEHTMLATLQYNRSDYKNTNREQALTVAFTDSAYDTSAANRFACATQACVNTYKGPPGPFGVLYADGAGTPYYGAVPGTSLQFGSNGEFLGGTLSDAQSRIGNFNFPNVNDAGQPYWGPSLRGAQQTWLQGIYDETTDMTADTSFHFKFTPTDRWQWDLDLQHVDATSGEQYRSSEFASYSTVTVDMHGDHPTFFDNGLNPYNFNVSKGGLANPDNYIPRDNMDHYADGKGQANAVRIDGKYKFGGTWFDSLAFGVREFSRQQTFDSSAYNWRWTYTSWTDAPWGAKGFVNGHLGNSLYDKSLYTTKDWNGYYDGALSTNTPFIVPNMGNLQDRAAYEKLWQAAEASNASQAPYWTPVCSNTGVRAGETVIGKNGCYLPSEVLNVREKDQDAYVRLNFGGTDAEVFNGITLSGNAGLRLVKTTITSYGARNFGTSFNDKCDETSKTPAGDYTDVTCYASASDIAFYRNASGSTADTSSNTIVLPSLNLKFKLNDTWLSRLSYSKGLSRPDMGNLRNYQNISATLINGATATSHSIIYTGSLGNPHLKPITADNFDLTFENYFAALGSFSTDVFYKKFNDYIVSGSGYLDVTNNGVTKPVLFTQPVNGKGGTVDGVEFAFQRTFDFLPGAWSGLGVQASATIVHSSGVRSTFLNSESADGSATKSYANPITVDALVGISPQSYTVSAYYDKGPFSARLAYAWRSTYLLSTTDANSPYPFWQKGNGYLDGSIQYKINDNMVLSINGNNIGNTETIVMQQVESHSGSTSKGANLQPYAYQKIDSRVGVGLRVKY